MRAVAGPMLANAMLVFAGLGVLRAAGALDTSRRGVLTAIGLAYFAGVAAVMLVVIALLVAGVPFGAATVVIVAAVLGAGGLAAGRRRPVPSAPERPPWTRVDRAVAIGGGVAFSAYALVGFLTAPVKALGPWDSWSLWTRKALVIADGEGLPLAYFDSGVYEATHPDYPILLPLLEAMQFSAAGTVDLKAMHVQFWLLLVFFVWALAARVSRISRPLVWVPILLAAALCPGVYQHLLSAYADVPLAFFFGLAVFLLGLWLASREPADLLLAALFLGAAANTKNEGLAAAGAALACAGLVCAAERDVRGALRILAAGAAVGLAVLPWRLWLAAHDITGDLPLGKGLDPGYLADRTERLGPTAGALHHQLAGEPRWFLLVPLATGLCLVSLIWRSGRRVPAFYALTGTAVLASLVWVYWLSPLDIDYHLDTSADRVVASLVFVALAALLHVAAAIEREVRVSGPGRRR